MKYGINILNFGDFADARLLADLAHDAERAGWDGFFIWDHITMDWVMPFVDPWIALTAIALNTEHIRLGAMVTPLPRRRPWKLARETVSLDRLSGGRLIVGVGIGNVKSEFDYLGEEADLKLRAAMLNEGLDVLTGLWSGRKFSYSGEHYTVREAQFLPTPLQTPRIPIWVAGMWPNKAPFRRAARWDGVFPALRDGEPNEMLTPGQIRDLVTYIKACRKHNDPFDVVMCGITPGDDPDRATRIVEPYIEAGATWWQEAINTLRPDLDYDLFPTPVDALHNRIIQGPPRP